MNIHTIKSIGVRLLVGSLLGTGALAGPATSLYQPPATAGHGGALFVQHQAAKKEARQSFALTGTRRAASQPVSTPRPTRLFNIGEAVVSVEQ
jgi:hypothetical protein